MMKVEFKTVIYASKAWSEAVKLRERILRIPLGEKFTIQELEEEKNHHHIIGIYNGDLVATAVLVPEEFAMKMQRVVVSENLRNLNIGSLMSVYCETLTQKEGYKTLYCHARDSAVNFYLKNNYKAEGDYFNEDGIPHLKMIKSLIRSNNQ
jgi:predicted GNAT family N-acyltransferase